MNMIDNGKDKVDEGQQAPYLNEWMNLFLLAKCQTRMRKRKNKIRQ
jgi:hypothetical protein